MNSKIGTFNTQGLLDNNKKHLLIKDFEQYNLSVLCVQETHNRHTGVEEIKSEESGKTYHLYNSGNEKSSHQGVGFLVETNKDIKFTPIDDRICQISTKLCIPISNNSKATATEPA